MQPGKEWAEPPKSPPKTWPVYSPFAREHFRRGKAEGRAEGRAEGEAHAVLRILASRGIDVPDNDYDRISACTDQQQLDTWLDRALIATSITDLFN